MDVSQASGLGFLCPGYAVEDGYPLIGKILGPWVRVEVMHTPWERPRSRRRRAEGPWRFFAALGRRRGLEGAWREAGSVGLGRGDLRWAGRGVECGRLRTLSGLTHKASASGRSSRRRVRWG